MNTFLRLCCLLLLAGQSLAQFAPSARVMVLPPYPTTFQELLSRKFENIIELTNPTTQPSQVRLRFRLYSDDTGISIASNPNNPGPIITLPPNTPLQLSAQQIGDVFSLRNLIYTGTTEREVLSMRAIPEGYYSLCVQILSATTGQPLSAESCSNPISIIALEPPTLRIIGAMRDDTLAAEVPQNILFQWNSSSNLRVAGINTIEYALQVVEVPPGMNPNQVILAAPLQTPEYRIGAGVNTFLFGPGQAPLFTNRRYAAVIRAIDPQNRYGFRNQGRSEPVVFFYALPRASSGAVPLVSKPDATSATDLAGKLLVQGQANWAFLSSEETFQQNDGAIGEISQIVTSNKTPGTNAHPLGGATVALYRNNKTDLLGTTTTQPDGSYSLTVVLTKGKPTTESRDRYLIQISHPQCVSNLQILTPSQPGQTAYQASPVTLAASSFRLAGVAHYAPRPVTTYRTVPQTRTRTVYRITGSQLVTLPNGRFREMPIYSPVTETYTQNVTVAVEELQPGVPINAGDVQFAVYRAPGSTDGSESLLPYEGELTGQLPAAATLPGLERLGPMVKVADLRMGEIMPRLLGFAPVYLVGRVRGSSALLVQSVQPASRGQASVIDVLYLKRLFTFDKRQTEISGLVRLATGTVSDHRPNVRVRVTMNAADLSDSGNAAAANATFETMTDQDGFYRVGNLPELRAGASYAVQFVDQSLSSTPYQRTVPTSPTTTSLRLDLTITSMTDAVVGQIVDGQGQPVAHASVRLRRSGQALTTSAAGVFVARMESVSDVLEISDGNSQTLTVPVEGASGGSRTVANRANDWVNRLTNTGTVRNLKLSAPQGDDFGYPGIDLNSLYYNLFNSEEQPLGVRDLGRLALRLPIGALTFVVLNTQSKPVQGAAIRLTGQDDGITDQRGEWHYKGRTGVIEFSVKPGPNSLAFVTQQGSFDLTANQVSSLTVTVEGGAQVQGVVTRQATPATPIANALVQVEGFNALTTRTDQKGKYTLNVPPNTELTLRFGADGFQPTTVVQSFSATTTVNASLSVNAMTTLAGFRINLTDLQAEGVNFRVSGTVFPGDNTLFKPATTDQSLKFANVLVKVDDKGNATAADGGPIRLDETQVAVRLFGKISMTLTGDNIQIKPIQNAPGKGIIGGDNVGFSQLAQSSGNDLDFDFGLPALRLPDDVYQSLQMWPVFTSASAFPLSGRLNLAFRGNAGQTQAVQDQLNTMMQQRLDQCPDATCKTTVQQQWNAARQSTPGLGLRYMPITVRGCGVILDLLNSYIDESGFTFVGSLVLPRVPQLSVSSIDITNLSMTPDFKFRSLAIAASDANPVRMLLQRWEGGIKALVIRPGEVLAGGYLKLKLPNSEPSMVSFSNVGMVKGQPFTGDFEVKNLDMAHTFSFSTGERPIHLGLADDGAYSVSGSGLLKLVRPIEKEFDLQEFEVRTNGKFTLNLGANITARVGPFNLLLEHLAVSNLGDPEAAATNTDGAFRLEMTGGVQTGLKQFNIEGKATVTFNKAQAGQPMEFDMNDVSGRIDAPAFDASVAFKYAREPDRIGFEGAGSFTLKKRNQGIKINARFYKLDDGFDFAATFAPSVTIPIGPVAITRVEGGFGLAKIGSDYSFTVGVGGAVSVTGFEDFGELGVDLTITGSSNLCTSGWPDLIVRGEGEVKVLNPLSGQKEAINKGSLEWQMCAEKIIINASIRRRIMPLVLCTIDGTLTVGYTKDQESVYLGADGKIEPEHIPLPAETNGRFEISWKHNNAAETFMKATVKSSFGYRLNINKNLGFFGFSFTGQTSNQLRFEFRSNFRNSVSATIHNDFYTYFTASGYIKLVSIEKNFNIASVEARASADARGIYSSGRWLLAGSFRANVAASAGDRCDCNDWCRWGITGCFDAGGSFEYDSNRQPSGVRTYFTF